MIKDQQDHKVTRGHKVHLVQVLKEIKDHKVIKDLKADLALDHKETKDHKVKLDHLEHPVRWVLMDQKVPVVDKVRKAHKALLVTLESLVELDLLELLLLSQVYIIFQVGRQHIQMASQVLAPLLLSLEQELQEHLI